MVQTVWRASGLTPAPAAPAPTFDPRFSYMRAAVDGRELFLALGYVDALPEGPTEVWYSSAGEVLRLRQGRIVGTTGLTTDWRAVRLAPEPAWPHPAADTAGNSPAEAVQFSRERDLMPGYRMRVRDAIQRVAIAAPPQHGMRQSHGPALRWFEERSTTQPAREALPPSRFAIAVRDGQTQVVYSEQCITQDLCVNLERWTPTPAPTTAVGTPGPSRPDAGS